MDPLPLINLPDVSVLPGGMYYWFMVADDDSDEMVNGDFFDLVETTIVP